MKKIIFAILISASVYAQEVVTTSDGKKVQLNKDKTWNYIDTDNDNILFNESDFKKIKSLDGSENLIKIDKTIKIKNGINELVNCEFSFFSKQELFDLTNDKFIEIIDQCRVNSKYKLKNASTFRPTKIMIQLDKEKNQWVVIMYFTGQNDYGATKDSSSISYFEKSGKYINTL